MRPAFRSPPSIRRRRHALRAAGGVGLGLLWAALAAGCMATGTVDLQQKINTLEEQVQSRDEQLRTRAEQVAELQRQLDAARSISEEDLKHIFYPDKLEIDHLTGGADYDNKPGDDGVTVYLRPVDRDGDTIKVVGDLRIQLYDLAADAAHNLVGEYAIPADQLGALWHGKLLTNHFTVKCPFLHGLPAHPELTVRATFVDFLTKRVVTAQTTCQVHLPPR